jgi:hypothetical protein
VETAGLRMVWLVLLGLFISFAVGASPPLGQHDWL